MTTSFDRKQAISKLNEFRDKISEHMHSIATKKEQSQKPYRYVIYEPKKIDISTQTVYEKSSRIKSSAEKQRPQLNDMRRQKRIAQLRQIVEDSFKHFFRKAKQKQNHLNSQIERLQQENQHLQKQISQKDSDLEWLREKLQKVSEQIQKPINELTKSRQLWEIQHKKDLNDIKNLQKGIAEYQKETQRLTAEINMYENDMIVKQKRIKQLQVLYKNSQHLVDAMSEQEVKMSSQLQKLQIEVDKKTSYIDYIEEMYLDSLRKQKQLQMEIEYFRDETQRIRQTLKQNVEELQMALSETSFYSKLSDSLVDFIKIQGKNKSLIQQSNQQKDDTFRQDQSTQNVQHQIQKLYEHIKNEQQNVNLMLKVQNKIIQEQMLLQKVVLQTLGQEKQRNLRNLFQISLQKALKQRQKNSSSLSSSQSQSQNSKLDDIEESFHDISSQSSEDEQNLNHEKEMQQVRQINKQQNQQIKSKQDQSQSNHQSSHKQIQTNHVLPLIQVTNIEGKDQIHQVQDQKEENIIKKDSQLLSPQPMASYRPPSFGNDNNTDMLPSQSDREMYETQTPHFTQVSSISSNVPQTFVLANCEQLDTVVEDSTHLADSCLKKKQSPQQNQIRQVEDTRFLKDLKGSDQIIHIEGHKISDEQFQHENLATPKNNKKKLPQINTNIDEKIVPHSKEAYCQATVEQNENQSRQKDKDLTKFIKKHQSMTNYIGIPPLSPSCQKQQSDCHLMVEKNKKPPKKKIEFKLPHNENEKVKKNLKDLQKQLFHNIQSHNSMWRKLQRDKFNRVLGCPKLSQRLAQLIQKQTSIQQQVIINQHNHPAQISGSMPGLNKEVKQIDCKNDKFLINEELQVMIDLQRLIRDTYEWILLVQRLNKREYDKHQRLVGRIKLKKTKTGIHHNQSKQKEQNQDKYESDQLVDLYKEKSVYSQGDSPRVAGDVDHFDISPYEHNQVPQKHEDLLSLEKLFKEGQQISQISSVKNQSQVSSFINARSEFANILYSKNYIKIQDEEIHPSLASANYESIQNIYVNQIHLSSGNTAYKHKQQMTSPQNQHHQQIHIQNKYDQKSIKSVRNMSSKQKDKIKILQKRNAEISNYYKRIIEKMKGDEKKKYIKVQKDFNKALTMALKLKSVHVSSNSLTPSIQKEVQFSHPPTSIKIIPNTQVKTSLSQIKSPPSKLQSKSLTQITLLSQKISEKDEILEQKIESYEKNIDELKIKNDEMKSSLNTKIQLIEQLQKKIKLQKLENQKIQKKSQQLKKQVQLLKTQNKKIKNEFSQFMTKLVTQQQQRKALIMRKLSSSGSDQIKQIHMGIPQLIKYAQSLVFSSGRLQGPLKKKQSGGFFQENQKLPLAQDIINVQKQVNQAIKKCEISTQTQDISQQNTNSLQNEIRQKETQNLLQQLRVKNDQIQSLKSEITQNSNKIKDLTQKLTKITQQKDEFQQQIDMLTIQISQKAVEISELTNSFKSIQVYQKKLQQKLTEAENKIQQYETMNNTYQINVPETPIKKFNTNQQQQSSLKVQDHIKSILPLSPMSSLNNSQNKSARKSKTKRKKSHGSLGSMEQNFFDLQNQKQFNNIEPSQNTQKDQRIKELQQMLFQATKEIQNITNKRKNQ